MQIKHSIDFSQEHTLKALVTGVLLGILGLLIVIAMNSLWWVRELSLGRFILYLVITLIPGTYIHEAYHRLMAKILKHPIEAPEGPLPEFPTIDGLRKWEALGIKLAPSVDLTIIAVLIIIFLPSPLNPFLSIFLVGNLAGSANDYIQSYYIYKLATPDSVIRLTASGLEIRE